jgi:AAA+ superfamily predicted ATPase
LGKCIFHLEFGLPDKKEIKEFIADYVRELPMTENVTEQIID